MGSSIIICGKHFDIETRVHTFEDRQGFNAYLPHRTDNPEEIHATHPAAGLEHRSTRYRHRRLLGREHSVERLRQVCRQMVVHLDGCRDAQMCFNVLHNQRGLSCHFLCDNDGTIYQTLDLATCAFHAGGVNEISVGVELQNRGDAARNPNYYKEGRSTVTCRVHGHQFLAYDFTEAQYDAMILLCRALTRILRIPLVSPCTAAGDLLWTTMDQPRQFTGFVGHYHLSKDKWDPGPWDFRRLFRGVGSRVTFPLTPPLATGDRRADKMEAAQFKRKVASYYEATEADAVAHFPVGPLGRSRLWHGGVHLMGVEGSPVFAPLQGRIRAARMKAPCPVGSCNFVLLSHSFDAGARSFRFFSLYMHLQREGEHWDDQPLPWYSRNPSAVRVLERGRIALLDDGIAAGELIGRIGEAGPPGHRRGQIHFAIFAAEEIGQYLDPRFWEIVDGGRTNRLCHTRSLIERIDRWPKDGKLSRNELRNFFQHSVQRQELRHLAVRHRSEWTPGDWESELSRAPDFAELSAVERAQLIAQQINPTLWWTPWVARQVGLPADGYVYSYHPITFVAWYRELLRKRSTERTAGIGRADQWEGVMAPKHLTVDAESSAGTTDEEDHLAGDVGQKLTLEDLVNGYPD